MATVHAVISERCALLNKQPAQTLPLPGPLIMRPCSTTWWLSLSSAEAEKLLRSPKDFKHSMTIRHSKAADISKAIMRLHVSDDFVAVISPSAHDLSSPCNEPSARGTPLRF